MADKNYPKDDKLRALHHFVPQSYLRRFAIDGKPDQIYAYELDKEPYPSNVKNVAAQRDLYTYTEQSTGDENAALENVFAEIDDKGANLLHKLDSMPDGYFTLPEKEQADLLTYIAYLHTRNIQERKHRATSMGQMSLVYLKTLASNKDKFHQDTFKVFGEKYDQEKIEQTRLSVLDDKFEIEYDYMDQHFLGDTLSITKDLYLILMERKQAVLVSTKGTSKVFVTSDNPVTHYGLPEQKALGLGYINAIFQIPITPTRCILLINKNMEMSTFDYGGNDVDHINFFTYYYADRWIFSNIKSKRISQMFKDHRATKPHTRISSPFNRKTKDDEL